MYIKIMHSPFPSFPQLLRDKLIPWASEGAAGRIIVAQTQMQQAAMPAGVTLTQRPMRGKRVAVKGSRLYNKTPNVTARWPGMGMHEVGTPRFIAVVEGDVNFQAGNYLLGCRLGDYIYLPQGIPHSGSGNPLLIQSKNPKSHCTLLWVCMYHGSIQCWQTRHTIDERENDPKENYLFQKRQPYDLFGLFVEEMEAGHEGSIICNDLMTVFWRSLHREIKQKNYLHPGPIVRTDDRKGHKSTFVEELEKYVSDHLSQPLTLEGTARKLYTSRTQFAQRIRQETGQTFVEYLTVYRLNEAKALLAESDWVVNMIARFVGFKSTPHFYTLFRKQTGLTPLQYRRKQRKATTGKK